LKRNYKLETMFVLLAISLAVIVFVKAEHHNLQTYTGTISAYGNWNKTTGCHKIRTKVIMNNITGSNRLLCTISQLDEEEWEVKYTLYEGYLYDDDDTGWKYTKEPHSDWIDVKLTETGGTSTSFGITVDQYEYTK
jgi:hypothetical protein